MRRVGRRTQNPTGGVGAQSITSNALTGAHLPQLHLLDDCATGVGASRPLLGRMRGEHSKPVLNHRIAHRVICTATPCL